MTKPKIAWEPQPGPQTLLLRCPADDIFYGGARGGGKTDGMLGEWGQHSASEAKKAKGMFCRRELPMLEEAIERAKEIYIPMGAEWGEQKKTLTMPNGSTLKFRPLENDADAGKYQGHGYTRIYLEELPQWETPRPIDKLWGALRSAKGADVGIRATGNPGGPGHSWVKERYIDNGAYEPVEVDVGGGMTITRVFIPAKVKDNRILVENDPGYIARLHMVGSDSLVRAWLEGDWNVVEGAYFECFGDKHIIPPFEIPKHWLRFMSMDWGSYHPFSVGWWAVAGEDYTPEGTSLFIPEGAMVRYREWYGAARANVGLKMPAEDVAFGIRDREPKDENGRDEDIAYRVIDPSAFAMRGGPSIVERMHKATGMVFLRADNARVAKRGPIGGWDQMRARLIGQDGYPMLYVFSTCKDFIRTIPMLQHSDTMPEDVEKKGEDHIGDETRYACMSRPWIPTIEPEKEPMKGIESLTMNDLWKRRDDMAVGRI